MKKLLLLVAATTMAFSLSACGSEKIDVNTTEEQFNGEEPIIIEAPNDDSEDSSEEVSEENIEDNSEENTEETSEETTN